MPGQSSTSRSLPTTPRGARECWGSLFGWAFEAFPGLRTRPRRPANVKGWVGPRVSCAGRQAYGPAATPFSSAWLAGEDHLGIAGPVPEHVLGRP